MSLCIWFIISSRYKLHDHVFHHVKILAYLASYYSAIFCHTHIHMTLVSTLYHALIRKGSPPRCNICLFFVKYINLSI